MRAEYRFDYWFMAGPILLTSEGLRLVKAEPEPGDLQVAWVRPDSYEVRLGEELRTLPATVLGWDVDVGELDGTFLIKNEDTEQRVVAVIRGSWPVFRAGKEVGAARGATTREDGWWQRYQS